MSQSSLPAIGRLTSLSVGQVIPFGGDRFVSVDPELASRFVEGDRLVVVQDTGSLIHVPRAVVDIVDSAVSRAAVGFARLAEIDPSIVDAFYERFAETLSDDAVFSKVAEANATDVSVARGRGRAVGRLELTDKMRRDMIDALRMWRDLPDPFGTTGDRTSHDSWSVEERRSPLGVVGFVFEGRPNVFADATGVLKSGNAVVFRIGSDALGTARALMEHCVNPACEASGLPPECVNLVDSAERSAGHALFSDSRLALAVARGSGEAVAQLGAVARQAGIPVSLHGTGGAWMHVSVGVDGGDIAAIVDASLDRKVCNTLNVLAVPVAGDAERRAALIGITSAAKRRGLSPIVHVSSTDHREWAQQLADDHEIEPNIEWVVHEGSDFLAEEWEWDDRPEVSVMTVADVGDTVDLFNVHSPRFVLSIVTNEEAEFDEAYRRSEAPFVGDGFTRWVDGQYALGRPELGLSNWQTGRLFGRGGILSGDGVFSVRYVARHRDSGQRR